MAFLKQYIKNIALGVALVAGFMCTACEKDFFSPDIDSKPRIYYICMIEAGEQIDATVCRTYPYETKEVTSELVLVTDASVELFVNGKLKETMKLTLPETEEESETLPYYHADYVAQPGDVIKIVATHPTLGKVEGETEVPDYPNLKDVFCESKLDTDPYNNNYFSAGTLSVKFHDDRDLTNYYLLDVYTVSKAVKYQGWDIGIITFDRFGSDPIFQEHIAAFDQALESKSSRWVFSDRKINGTDYTLKVNFEGWMAQLDDMMTAPKQSTVKCSNPLRNTRAVISMGSADTGDDTCVFVCLQNISASYYRFIMSKEAEESFSGGLGEIGLADKSFLKSNLSTGAGLLAARAATMVPIPAQAFYPETLPPPPH